MLAHHKYEDAPPPYSVREAADHLHIGYTTMKRAISHRLIKSFLIGRARRIPADEIERVQREGLPVIPPGYRATPAPPCPVCEPSAKRKR